MVFGNLGSQTALHEANQTTLLNTIRRIGAMTQIELAETTGLSTATVSNIVHQLVDDKVLETTTTIRNGRRAVLVALARQEGLAVGLAIGRQEMIIDVVDSTQQVLAEHILPLPMNHKVDSTIERALILINETIANMGASPSEIIGIGLALSAPVDVRTGQIPISGIMRGWDRVDLAAPFAKAFRVPIFVANDANMAAVAESRVGAASGLDNFVYVNVGSGVGAGIFINGQLWTGVTGFAGEIGHIQVDPLGSICICGNRGCLNTIVDETRLVSLLSVTHGDMTLDDLIESANEGDPGCRRVLADVAVRVGTVVAGLCITVDPEIVVLGGKLLLTGDVFVDPFQDALQRLLFPDVVVPMEVRLSQNPVSNGAIGAAINVLANSDKYRGLSSVNVTDVSSNVSSAPSVESR
jgi:predicted NBD/HSP70 family sugar kinase